MSDYEAIMNEEVERVNEALADYFESRITEIGRLGPIHKQYYNVVKEYLMRGGKRLRPVLVVGGYKAVNGSDAPKSLYLASCSVELLHNGSLLHDDLIDHDETRRGGKTIHAYYRDWFQEKTSSPRAKAEDFGMAMAILGGDSLLNMGAQVITSARLDPGTTVRCLQYYQSAYHDLADGVLLEMHLVQQPQTSAEVYLDMIRMKTAVLMEKSLLIGGAIADATTTQLGALSKFGVKVGQAFQVQDDILGSFGDEEVTGKPADGDIREGKKTLLVIESFNRADSTQSKSLKELLGKSGMSSEEVDTVRDLFRETGALPEAERMMEQLLEEGQSALDEADPAFDKKYHQFLLDLSEFLIHRKY
ncbi:polyprenyl synthetase family protein [Candidatus Thorarchaeota archaeon]|nr:MAG: polyprenyl synthetase family protein [Candidatus Thorarchaeota archaeon]